MTTNANTALAAIALVHGGFVDGSGWEDGPDAWVEVPAERVTPPNLRPPVPFGLACWRARKSFGSGGFTCFTPGTGT